MATVLWPFEVLMPQHISVDIASRSLSGAVAISGAVQVVSSDAGIWKVTYQEVAVVDRARILAWRGISGLLEGRLNPILVPVTRFYQPAWIEDENGDVEPIPHSDGAFFGDGSGYVGSVNSVTLAGSVAARATTANISIAYGGTLEPGQHFSLGERLYRVRSVTYTSDTAATITFRPPLREAASLGDRLEFDAPICRMKLAVDNAMDLPLEIGRWSFPTVNFVEDV
jgi:hypothetical protein